MVGSRLRRKRVLIPIATIAGLVVVFAVLVATDLLDARGEIGGQITPDPHSRDLNLTKRVIGVPGDTVGHRDNRVFVNGKKADDIPTAPFLRTHLGPNQYFVLGDNRSASQHSRAFGPVPRNTIFARAILTYWPLGRFGTPGYNKNLMPPGEVSC